MRNKLLFCGLLSLSVLTGLLCSCNMDKFDIASNNPTTENAQQTRNLFDDFRIGLQLADRGGTETTHGTMYYTPYVDGARPYYAIAQYVMSQSGGEVEWATPWTSSTFKYDPDYIRISLQPSTLGIFNLNGYDVRVGIQFCNDRYSTAGFQQGEVKWTPWASQIFYTNDYWSGWASDIDDWAPDSARLYVGVRKMSPTSNMRIKDFQIGIQVAERGMWDNNLGRHGPRNSGVVQWTPFLGANGGESLWASDGNDHSELDLVRIGLNCIFVC